MDKSTISHKGNLDTMVTERAISEGATGLNFGEIIGFSGDSFELLSNWINSPTHNSVLLDEKWTWVGIGKTIIGDRIVSVINFSSGNLGSTSFVKKSNSIIFKGEYLTTPQFKGNFNIISINTSNNSFNLEIKPNTDSFFIYGYNSAGTYVDRADVL